MKVCRRCGSYAINPHQHGRQEGDRLDLCDVCYWRDYAERANEEILKTIEMVRSKQRGNPFELQFPPPARPPIIDTEDTHVREMLGAAYEATRQELKAAWKVWFDGPEGVRDPEEVWAAAIDRVLPPR